MDQISAKHALGPDVGLCDDAYKIVSLIDQSDCFLRYLGLDRAGRPVQISEFFPTDRPQRQTDLGVYADPIAQPGWHENLQQISERAKQLARLRHPMLTPILHVFEENQTVYVVSAGQDAHAKASSITDTLSGLPPQLAKNLGFGLTALLAYFHGHKLYGIGLPRSSFRAADPNSEPKLDLVDLLERRQGDFPSQAQDPAKDCVELARCFEDLLARDQGNSGFARSLGAAEKKYLVAPLRSKTARNADHWVASVRAKSKAPTRAARLTVLAAGLLVFAGVSLFFAAGGLGPVLRMSEPVEPVQNETIRSQEYLIEKQAVQATETLEEPAVLAQKLREKTPLFAAEKEWFFDLPVEIFEQEDRGRIGLRLAKTQESATFQQRNLWLRGDLILGKIEGQEPRSASEARARIEEKIRSSTPNPQIALTLQDQNLPIEQEVNLSHGSFARAQFGDVVLRQITDGRRWSVIIESFAPDLKGQFFAGDLLRFKDHQGRLISTIDQFEIYLNHLGADAVETIIFGLRRLDGREAILSVNLERLATGFRQGGIDN